MKKQVFTFFLLSYFLVCSFMAKAVVLPVTSEQLVNGADIICIAQVKPGSMKSYWVTTQHGDRWMESDVDLTVSQYIKGEGATNLTAHIMGGKIDEQMERNSVSVWFEDQEEVVLFLKKSKTQKNYLVYKNFLGKYTIDPVSNTITETGDTVEVFVDKINILLNKTYK